jgi:hypothetical protein
MIQRVQFSLTQGNVSWGQANPPYQPVIPKVWTAKTADLGKTMLVGQNEIKTNKQFGVLWKEQRYFVQL